MWLASPATVWAIICFDFHLTLFFLFCALTGVYISYLHPFFLSSCQYLRSKSNSQQLAHPGRTMLQCCLGSWFLLDFGSANCIFNLPLMNFQFDNWQNAAHERAEATHMKAWKTSHAIQSVASPHLVHSHAKCHRMLLSCFRLTFALCIPCEICSLWGGAKC